MLPGITNVAAKKITIAIFHLRGGDWLRVKSGKVSYYFRLPSSIAKITTLHRPDIHKATLFSFSFLIMDGER
jgi:hypothetical protein